MPIQNRPIRLCVVVTVDITLINLCRGRFEYLQSRGFEVTAVCAPTGRAAEIEARGVRLHTAPLTRSISPLTDALAVWDLYRFFRREKFDLVEVSTPKAALVGAIAAEMAGVPHLVHLLRGLAYLNNRGVSARLLRQAARIPCRLAERTLAISQLTLDQAVGDGVCPPDRGVVLGAGSSNGIELGHFRPPTAVERTEARRALKLPDDAIVAGFVGRITQDKGIVELVEAFEAAAANTPNLHLLLAGSVEDRDKPPPRILEAIVSHQRIHSLGWVHDTRQAMAAMDFFVLPTHREGFGTVLLEAAAMKVPVISTDEAGWWGALAKGEDALAVPVKDARALNEAFEKLSADPDLRRRLAEAAYAKVVSNFDCRQVWALQEAEFRRLVGR